MCNPIALTAASMVGTLFTQHQQGKAQAAMYNQQARVAEANARISDRKQEQIADQALTKNEIKCPIRCDLSKGRTRRKLVQAV